MASASPSIVTMPHSLDRLLALPAELRQEIYSYLLPDPIPTMIIRARYARFSWIVVSRRLFNDVAPMIYSNSWLLTYLKLDPEVDSLGTVAGSFKDHLRLTYGPDALNWVTTDACSIIRRISVDVAAPDLSKLPDQSIANITSTFTRYFATVTETFSNLQSIRICFQDGLTHRQWCPDQKSQPGPLGALDELKQTLPENCELEVLLRGTRNYNALSPLVMLSAVE